MDIRIINTRGAIVNATALSIMASGNHVIGLTEESKQVLIESCISEEEALARLEAIKEALIVGQEEGLGSVIVEFHK